MTPMALDRRWRPMARWATIRRSRRLSDEAEAALYLLQAELRAGHQSADRPDPRGTGDEPGLDHRAAAEPVRSARAMAEAPSVSKSRQPILTERRSGKDPVDLGTIADNHFRSRRRSTPPMPCRVRRRRARRRCSIELCARAEARRCARAATTSSSCPTASAGSDRIPIPAHCSPDGRRASSPDPHGSAHLGRAGRRDPASRARCITSRCLAGYGAEAINPVSGVRNHHRDDMDRLPAALDDQGARGGQALHQVDRQGPVEGDVEDGHLDLSVLLRRADFRRGRAEGETFVEEIFRRHGTPGSKASASPRSPRKPRVTSCATRSATALMYKTRRSTSAANTQYRHPRRGSIRMDRCSPSRLLQHAVRGEFAWSATRKSIANTPSSSTNSPSALLTLRGLFKNQVRRGRKAASPIPLDEVESAAKDIVKRFATGAMSLRLDLARGSHHAGDRHEPDRRQVQHRRRRRGERIASSRCPTAIRCARRSSRSPPGVSASPPNISINADMMQIKMAQGAKPGEGGQLPGHKVDATIAQGAAFDARRRPDLAAAASRHLFDRGSGAADLRPQERQSGRPAVSVKLVSEIGVGTVAAGVAKAPRRPRHHRRLRRRHGRLAAHLDQARRQPLGNRPCRNPPDPGAASGCAARIIVQVDGGFRTGRDVVDRRVARGRRIRLCHRALDRSRLHHDAQVPSQHLPGRGGDPGSGAAQALHRARPNTSSTYFFFVAEEVREIMAALGYRKLQRDGRARPRCSTSRRWWRTGRRRGSISRKPVRHKPEPNSQGQTRSIHTPMSQDHQPRGGARPHV